MKNKTHKVSYTRKSDEKSICDKQNAPKPKTFDKRNKTGDDNCVEIGIYGFPDKTKKKVGKLICEFLDKAHFEL